MISSVHREYVERCAQLYGGQCLEWDKAPGTKQPKEWRVITETDTLPVYVLPFPAQQALEYYDQNRRMVTIRCDGQTCRRRQPDGRWASSPCECRPEEQEINCGAQLITRVSFVLPQIPTIGVWMLETKGYHAAVEVPTTMEFVRVQGRLVSRALLRLERRSRPDPKGGPDRVFYVPVLHIESAPEHLEALPGQRSATPMLAMQARALMSGEDPMSAEFQDVDSPPDSLFSDENPGYTERDFLDVLAEHGIRHADARGYLAGLRPPLDQLDARLRALAAIPGVVPETRVMQLKRQNVNTWDGVAQAIEAWEAQR